MKAVWNDQVIAKSDQTIVVESNHYFPIGSINKEFFKDSDTTSICPWKGEAKYYSLNVNGKINQDAAWYYPDTKEKANHIKGMVAFWRGVQVIE